MSLITLTPQQAADRARVSRGTIMNAIKDSSLIAIRDNRNRWQIPSDELAKWVSDRTANVSAKVSETPANADTSALSDQAARIAVLEAELRGKDQRIADLQQDRDSWKEQAQELARRTSEPALHAPAKRRWWWPLASG